MITRITEQLLPTEREYARRLTVIYRSHGIGRDPLTGALPTHVPILDGSFRASQEMRSEIDALAAEFAGAEDMLGPIVGRCLRSWEFSESELAVTNPRHAAPANRGEPIEARNS